MPDEIAVELAPIFLPTHDEIAQLLRQLQASPEAAPLLVQYMAQYGDQGVALRRLGLAMWGRQELPMALKLLLAAQALTGDNADLWRDLAGVLVGLKDFGRSETCLRHSLRCDPRNAQSWLMLGEQQNRKQDHPAAEHAYKQAAALQPDLAQAHFGLGILYFQRNDIDPAINSLRDCLALTPNNILARLCLGHVLYLGGDFAAAAAAFEIAARATSLDRATRRKQARAKTFLTMIAGRAEQALAEYPALAGDVAEDVADIARDAFGLLSAFGHIDAAKRIGAIRLAQNPNDATQRYLLAALSGQGPSIAPAIYVEEYFDHFAPNFDRQLVDVLQYDVPAQLHRLVAGHRAQFNEILDLGCGTGLAADALASFGGTLSGVDLSGGMLAHAEKRGRYQSLMRSEAVAYLHQHRQAFDLVFAADLLIYLGDLTTLFDAVRHSLRPGGLFAFNYETSDGKDYAILPSGRFAHTPSYVARVSDPAFEWLEDADRVIRREANRPVAGHLAVLRLRP